MNAFRISVIVLIIFIIALTGCERAEVPVIEPEETEPFEEKEEAAAEEPKKAEEPPPLDEIPVSRAQAAKTLALTFLTPDEIEAQEEIIAFSDVGKTDWHYKYINAAANLNYMLGGKGEFRPDAPMTVYEAQMLIDRVNPQNKTQIKITDETRDLPISYALWQRLYIDALTELSGEKTPEQKYGLTKEKLVVLATPVNAEPLPQWSMVSDKGWYFSRGFGMDAYTDRSVSVYSKRNEILLVSETEGEAVIENAHIKDAGSGFIDVFAGGARRTYRLGGNTAPIPEIADVKISGETAEIVNFPGDKKQGEIKRVTDKYIELSDGKISAEKDVPFFVAKAGGDMVYTGVNGLIPGTEAVFYLKGGKVCAAIASEKPKPEKMRILISSQDYKMSVHTSVKLSATSGFTVISDEGEKKYEKGEALVFDKDNNALFSSERIYVVTDEQDGLIELQSVKRNGEFPKYRGTIEITKEGEVFVIVNELEFEKYLYSVVSSQLPESLAGAAEAQAIVARSAAYSLFYENRFAYYGANADDSVKSQLYGAVPESKTAAKAVEDTKGEMLVYEDEAVKPAFFLASAGYTANRGETFQKAGGVKFPSGTPEYLSAKKQFEGGDYGVLSNEENAALFLKDDSVNAYEKGSVWFRWSVEMDKEALEASINAGIKERSSAYPSQVLTLSNGVYAQKPVESIGEFINMEVVKRGEGGNIMELKIVGTNGEYIIKTEGATRAVIRPCQPSQEKPPVILTRNDGSQIENYQSMPSAFFIFDIKRGENAEILSINFYGGGNGHGVGMSQTGAAVMADSGASRERILEHYFSGVVIEKMEDMEGA